MKANAIRGINASIEMASGDFHYKHHLQTIPKTNRCYAFSAKSLGELLATYAFTSASFGCVILSIASIYAAIQITGIYGIIIKMLVSGYLLFYMATFQSMYTGHCRFNGLLHRHIIQPWIRQIASYLSYKLVTPYKDELSLTIDRCTRLSNRPILFGCHPHGMFSLGTLCFILDPCGQLAHLFAKLDLHIVTIRLLFAIPVLREVLADSGMIDASRTTLNRLIQHQRNATNADSASSNKVLAIAVVVGGATEALYAKPKTMNLVLNCRNGFFRMALEHGATIVPVLSIGENDLYDQYTPIGKNNTKTDAKHYIYMLFQSICRRLFGCVCPLILGRGDVFGCSTFPSLLPFRRPVTVVVGKPIELDLPVRDPSPEQVHQLKERYVEELKHLYLTEAPNCLDYPIAPLTIVQ